MRESLKATDESDNFDLSKGMTTFLSMLPPEGTL